MMVRDDAAVAEVQAAFRLRGGKIAEFREYSDSREYAAALESLRS